MFRIFRLCVALLGGLPAVMGEAQAQSNQGSFKSNGKSFTFRNVVALRGESSGEPRRIVIATSRPLSAEVIAKARAKDAEENLDSEIEQPYLKAVFLESGELRYLIGMGGNTSFMTGGPPLEGKATIQNEKMQGSVTLIETGRFAMEARLTFDVAIGGGGKPAVVAMAPPVKPTITGKFLGNGKEATLKYVTVHEREPFGGKDAVTILFSEGDPSKSARPAFDAAFKKFGSALILSVNIDGGVFGCEVVHAAHAKSPFSSVGTIHMVEFDLSGGNAKGHVSSGGQDDFFEQTWEVDLKFEAPLPQSLRNPMARTSVASTTPKTAGKSETADAKPKNAGPKLAIENLTLPEAAKDVEYMAPVQQLTFRSNSSAATVARDFRKSLASEGWKEGTGTLVGKQNAIVNCTKGDAELTIMIQPAGSGSQVQVFTQGLDWSGAPSEKKKSKGKKASEGLDQESKDLIDEVLKELPDGVPKGLLKQIK